MILNASSSLTIFKIIKGSEDQKNALRKGDVGTKKIYGQLRREEKRDELIQKAKLAPPIPQLKQSGNANVQPIE